MQSLLAIICGLLFSQMKVRGIDCQVLNKKWLINWMALSKLLSLCISNQLNKEFHIIMFKIKHLQ